MFNDWISIKENLLVRYRIVIRKYRTKVGKFQWKSIYGLLFLLISYSFNVYNDGLEHQYEFYSCTVALYEIHLLVINTKSFFSVLSLLSKFQNHVLLIRNLKTNRMKKKRIVISSRNDWQRYSFHLCKNRPTSSIFPW